MVNANRFESQDDALEKLPPHDAFSHSNLIDHIHLNPEVISTTHIEKTSTGSTGEKSMMGEPEWLSPNKRQENLNT